MKLKRIFFLLALCSTSAAQSQTVNFSYTTASGLFCNPQKVIFTQECTGNPDGYIWNFGNGHSSTHGTDSTVYNSPGTYTVSLTALYTDIAVIYTKTITINPAPSITLSSNTDIICQPGNIDFTVTGSSFITAYEWDFGDGSPLQTTGTNTVTHHFADYLEYTVTVKGITAFGCYAVNSHVIKVQRFTVTGHPPNADPPEGCIPKNVMFNVTTDISAPDFAQSFLWDFDDGSPLVPGTSNTITHLYNSTDSLWPHVTITSAQGCVSVFDFSPSAYGTPPTGTHIETMSGRDTFCGNELIVFQASAVNANFYSFTFGDGDFANGPSDITSHKYHDTGWKRIIVTAFFNGCPGPKDTIMVYVEGVIAEFEYSNTCADKNIYSFENVSDGHISRYEWRFSDNPSIRDSVHFNVTHAFPVNGTYVTSLYLTDSLTACSDTLHWAIYTALPVFTSGTSSVCKDSVITYSVNHTYPAGSSYEYFFNVPGNIIDNDRDSVLNYYPHNHGSYSDYVVITDFTAETCDDTLYLPHPTKINGPVVDFTAPVRECMNVPVVFTNNSHPFYPADNIIKWQWDFWDGKTDTVRHPAPHLYTSPGTYTVLLTATDATGCAAKKEVNVIIDPIPEITVYPRVDTICLGRDTATLSAYTIDNFVWIPGTDISCINCDTVKVYPPVTTHYIAKATNAGGCSTSDTSLVKVYAPFNLQVFPGADVFVCPKIPVEFSLNTQGITAWSPGAYLNDSTAANPVAAADSSLIFEVIVKDSAGCYADTSFLNLHVYPPPVVNAGPDLILPYGTNFMFDPVYHPSTQAYLWTPSDDLSCSNCSRPNGTALQTKNYTIEVTSDKGCKAKDDIAVKLTCGGLYLPSAFTPNNGGPNDYFYPIGRGYKSIKTFIIYNRLGNKVFERQNFTPNISSLGWDGTVKENSTGNSTQAFVWYVEAVCEQGGQIVSSKGTVLLLR